MTKQFVACTFRPGQGTTYTYHYEGDEPLAVGDEVLVEGRSGSELRVHVAEVGTPEPSFPTKPVLGRAPAKDPSDD